MQIVFQDPYSSLDPRATIASSVGEPLAIYEGLKGKARNDRVRGAAGGRRTRARGPRPVPAPVLRRAAPAHRDRAGARAAARAARVRRAAQLARRVDPVTGPEPAHRAPGRAEADVSVHLARPRGRPPHQRPHRGDVPRPHRRDRRRRGRLPPPDPPVHRGAALRDPRSRPGRAAAPQAHRPRRRHPEPDGAAVGLPLPPAVPRTRWTCAARSTRRRSRPRTARRSTATSTPRAPASRAARSTSRTRRG